MSSLRQIRYFLKVAELGGFTPAADALFIAQPALSRQIAQLESELGFPLFERLPRGVRLTPGGALYRTRMLAILDQLDAAAEAGRDVALGAGGVLRLLHSSSIPVPAFLPTLQHMLAAIPRLRIDLDRLSSEQQLAALEAGQADLGLIRLPVLRRAPSLQVFPLAAEALYVIAPPGHWLAAEAGTTLAALAQEPFVSAVHRERGGLARRVSELCAQRGFVPRLAPVISRKTAMLDLVAAGLGIAIVPAGLAEMAAPSCVRCPLTDPDAMAERAVVLPAAATPLAQRFVEALLSEVGTK